MIAIDEHVKTNNLEEAQGIIMDIEGAEYYALQGMTNTLKSSKFLYIEYVPHHLENVSITSNEDFFSLILPHYNTAKFMKNESISFDIGNSNEEFLSYVNELKDAGKSDDILFTK